jgi:hypothetical protein
MAQRQFVKRPVMERGWIFLRDSNSGESAPASAMGITLRGAGRGREAVAVSSGSGFGRGDMRGLRPGRCAHGAGLS